MKSINGRPVIEKTDYPETVDRALHESITFWNESMPSDQSFRWQKIANDAWEPVQDGFHIADGRTHEPNYGKALLHMSPDQLELALVAYGCAILDDKINSPPAEINKIDALLKAIDKINR